MITYRRLILLTIFLGLSFTVLGQTPSQKAPQQWILNGYSEGIKGIGIAPYSSFNPEEAWKKAIQNGINDLNANHSLIVYSYGHQIGRGPLRTESEYAIRSILDTTQVTVVDSTRWKGKAFVLVEPTVSVADSIIYPQGKFRTPGDSTMRSLETSTSGQWLQTTGATQQIDSNWYMSITKAKQQALRKLAEDLAVKVSTKTYSQGTTSRRYYSFSSMVAFQRIRVLKRSFKGDSVKITIAVNPREVKILME